MQYYSDSWNSDSCFDFGLNLICVLHDDDGDDGDDDNDDDGDGDGGGDDDYDHDVWAKTLKPQNWPKNLTLI